MREPFELEPHTFKSLKGISSVCCIYCGLVRTNNYLTQFAIKHGCNWSNHPAALNAMSTMPKSWQQRIL